MSSLQARSSDPCDAKEMTIQPYSTSPSVIHPSKGALPATSVVDDDDKPELQELAERATSSSHMDFEDMRRMGREQQLVRRFRLLSIASFIAMATVSWEYGIMTMGPGLMNGGRSGLVYSTIWAFVGFGPVYLSMAEMASMAPIAGAQFHWVSEFAPESCQRILSYLVGWFSTIAWQAGNASGIFMLGSTLQSLIVVLDEDYVAKPYQSFLLALLAIIVAYIGNVYGARFLPYWQNALFLVHIMAFLAYIIPIWVAAPMVTNDQVWKEFDATGGWNSMALTIMVGQLTGISNQVAVDAAAHMAEEVKDAGLAVPKSMVLMYLVNFAVLLPTILTAVYHMPDLDAALNDSTSYAGIYVFRQAASRAWTAVFLAFLAFIFVAGNITYLAAVTRDLFAFARDQGLPFSSWISKVDDKHHVPVNATLLSCSISLLLALIYLGSSVAFYAIISLFAAAILACYTVSIGCVLWRRLFLPKTLPPARFSLGRAGLPLNAFATAFCAYSSFWAFWPQENPVTAENFNWASVIFGVTMIVSLLYFSFRARHWYAGPVALVEGRKER